MRAMTAVNDRTFLLLHLLHIYLSAGNAEKIILSIYHESALFIPPNQEGKRKTKALQVSQEETTETVEKTQTE